MVSTIVLPLMTSRELEPLAIFAAFVKIEMRMVPYVGKRLARFVAEINYHIKPRVGLAHLVQYAG